jgi:hypothetical protein
MVGHLRILQDWAPNTPETFRAVSSSGFSRDFAWSQTVDMLSPANSRKFSKNSVLEVYNNAIRCYDISAVVNEKANLNFDRSINQSINNNNNNNNNKLKIILSRVYNSVTNKNLFWIVCLYLLTPSFAVSLNQNQL